MGGAIKSHLENLTVRARQDPAFLAELQANPQLVIERTVGHPVTPEEFDIALKEFQAQGIPLRVEPPRFEPPTIDPKLVTPPPVEPPRFEPPTIDPKKLNPFG